jgi:hypothetical protein
MHFRPKRQDGQMTHFVDATTPSKTRAPVKRPTAETNILISLAGFGLTVAGTRVFLELTGYPQVGGSVLHIAHAIWGGLLLFVAVLVMLILANRWAVTISAVLSGIGVGLFIDEVGKFITQKNDYFFPPAAPLIYASFLLMVLLFLLVRRSRPANPRASMYRVLLGLREVLDNNLDPRERDHLLADLQNGRAAQDPHVALLAESLSAYLQHDSLPLTSYRPGLWQRVGQRVRTLGERAADWGYGSVCFPRKSSRIVCATNLARGATRPAVPGRCALPAGVAAPVARAGGGSAKPGHLCSAVVLHRRQPVAFLRKPVWRADLLLWQFCAVPVAAGVPLLVPNTSR